jgi:hypothetical protein
LNLKFLRKIPEISETTRQVESTREVSLLMTRRNWNEDRASQTDTAQDFEKQVTKSPSNHSSLGPH